MGKNKKLGILSWNMIEDSSCSLSSSSSLLLFSLFALCPLSCHCVVLHVTHSLLQESCLLYKLISSSSIFTTAAAGNFKRHLSSQGDLYLILVTEYQSVSVTWYNLLKVSATLYFNSSTFIL